MDAAYFEMVVAYAESLSTDLEQFVVIDVSILDDLRGAACRS